MCIIFVMMNVYSVVSVVCFVMHMYFLMNVMRFSDECDVVCDELVYLLMNVLSDEYDVFLDESVHIII